MRDAATGATVKLARCGVTALILALLGPSHVEARSPSAQDMVSIDLRVEDGVAALHAFALPGVQFTIDPAKLRFEARPIARSSANPQPLDAEIGAAQFEPPPNSPGTGLVEYALPVTFRPTQARGMYHVELHAAPGFAHDAAGKELVYGDWSRAGEQLSFDFWSHGPMRDDRQLRELSRKLTGGAIYGYGGLIIQCPPFVKTYRPTVAIHVREVRRDWGQVAELWTGAMPNGGNDLATHFFTLDPIRLVTDDPPGAASGTLGAKTPARADSPCPAIVLAEFQIGTTLSLQPPSRDSRRAFGTFDKIEIGMTRREVAWQLGYPQGYASRAQLDQLGEWRYQDNPRPGYTITFAHDRVASFEPPQR